MSLMMPVAREPLVGYARALKASYTRMNDDILRVVHAIPAGRLTTVDAISQYLGVPARHVSYLLARRFDAEREAAPWHRVLAYRGAIGRPLLGADGRTQIDRLIEEGVVVGYRGRVEDFTQRVYVLSPESTGVTPSQHQAA